MLRISFLIDILQVALTIILHFRPYIWRNSHYLAIVVPFKTDIQVLPEDIDDLGHVNNVVYVRWAQEVASRHWSRYAGDLAEQYLWVVLRHELDYRRPAFLNDTLIGETWISSFHGVKSVRRVNIVRGDDILCEVNTTWCLLDRITRRPTRIPQALAVLFSAWTGGRS